MRRITGELEGTQYVVTEYDQGMVEVPSVLPPKFLDSEGRVVIGAELAARCYALFGDTYVCTQYGGTSPDAPAA